ncbi:hypothetical protein D9615_006333 [Tricholomella constricta]|uniref:ATP-dependent DNA helicase n=1 Tax=Tricholomella constricta TaxID=117010 RepID=A0A8H5M1A1_9AGAR|nr:hypothetical protein D9615_006333 [Tricholomella constricta]
MYVLQIGWRSVEMIPTSPMTPGHSTPRQKYPNSTRYWQDHRTQRIDLGLQTLPSSPATRATPRVPSARTTSCYISSPLQCAQQQQLGPSDASVLSSVVKMAPIELSDEQKVILELVKAGGNVFFTGAAGTGKSVLLRAIIGHLRTNFAPDAVAVTATTGIAGVNIGGSTVHSFAGIRLGKETAAILADNIKRSTSALQRWRRVKVLIVDESECYLLPYIIIHVRKNSAWEVSMMDGQLFDKLEYVARVLPPVPEQSYEYRMPSTYAFDAASWSRDSTFVDILSSMRVGVLLAEHIDQLQRLSRPLHYDDGIMASEM